MKKPRQDVGAFLRLLPYQHFLDLGYHSLGVHPRRAENGLGPILRDETVIGSQNGMRMPVKTVHQVSFINLTLKWPLQLKKMF